METIQFPIWLLTIIIPLALWGGYVLYMVVKYNIDQRAEQRLLRLYRYGVQEGRKHSLRDDLMWLSLGEMKKIMRGKD